MPATPRLDAVLETGLYVADMARARRFYETVLQLEPMFDDHRMTAYPVGPSALLLFQQGATHQTEVLPGGSIPPHRGAGGAHYAFAVAAASLDDWRSRLAAHEIDIEGEVRWPRGAVSVYFRDPDDNLLELVTPGIWANY
ncbi:VOC family protein [Verticiella sediminum]|nr:VOC family protein [Verticiella sediminum]